MNAATETVYLVEILAQCRNARRSWHGVRRARNALVKFIRGGKPASVVPGRHTARLFDDAADFLQHAAAVSRVLWPPRSSDAKAKVAAAARAAHLKQVLAVQHGHALESRRLRDHLEHYDERIDKWAALGFPAIVDGYFGPRSDFKGNLFHDSNIMRLYEPATDTFFFRGESFDLNAAVRGLRDIRSRAKTRLGVLNPGLLADLTARQLI